MLRGWCKNGSRIFRGVFLGSTLNSVRNYPWMFAGPSTYFFWNVARKTLWICSSISWIINRCVFYCIACSRNVAAEAQGNASLTLSFLFPRTFYRCVVIVVEIRNHRKEPGALEGVELGQITDDKLRHLAEHRTRWYQIIFMLGTKMTD